MSTRRDFLLAASASAALLAMSGSKVGASEEGTAMTKQQKQQAMTPAKGRPATNDLSRVSPAQVI